VVTKSKLSSADVEARSAELGTSPIMVVDRTGRPKVARVRSSVVLIDGLSNIDYSTHQNTIEVAERALLERVFFVPLEGGNFGPTPKAEPKLFNSRLKDFRRQLLRRMPKVYKTSYEEFVQLYPPERRESMARAAESLRWKKLCYADSFISAFCKVEKTDFTSKHDPAPRLIQPRGARYNVELGRYVKHVEHLIYERVGDVFGEPTISKGMNAQQVGRAMAMKYNKFGDTIMVGLDASRFDQHCGVPALKWEHSIYNAMYRHDPELRKLLLMQLRNRGYVRCDDGTIKYVLDGCRMSGDMNTALGNCLLMTALVYAYMVSKGFSTREFSLINNGDDCVLFLERRDEGRIADLTLWFREMGYTMKREPTERELERATFCQGRTIWTGTDHVMVREVNKCISKDLLCVRSITTEEEWDAHRDAVSKCGLAMAANIPVLGAFYEMLGRGARPGRIGARERSGMMYLAQGMSAKRLVTDECRTSFFKAFDVVPDVQRVMEEALNKYDAVYRPMVVGTGKSKARAFLP